MRIRLWKELRVLMPYLIGLLALDLMAIVFAVPYDFSHRPSFHQSYLGALLLGAFIQLLIFHLAAVNLYSHEFSFLTMDRLLSQPVSRYRLWCEKAAALLIMVLLVLAANASLCLFVKHLLTRIHSTMRNLHLVEVGLIIPLCAAALAMASGPLMALLIRQTRTAFLASLVLPVLILTIFSYFDYTVIQAIFGKAFSDWANAYFYRSLGEFNLMILFTIPWFLVVFPLGWLKFKRLEV